MKRDAVPRTSSQRRPRFTRGIKSACALASVALLTGCSHEKHGATVAERTLPSATVKVQLVSNTLQPATEQVVGTIRARLRATLEAKISGRVAELPVVLGQHVKAQDLLVRLDAAEVRARVQQAEATLKQAEIDWKRTSSLFEQQASTRAEYDAADSRLRLAKAALAEAAAISSYIDLVAPFDGVITRKWADRGDLAIPGKPLLSLEDPSALQLEADLPEGIPTRVERGSSMSVLVDAAGLALEGKVAEIAPTADPETRTFKVKLDLPSTNGLMPGQFARLVVPLGERKSLLVPRSAVVQRGQLDIVFVAAEQRARMHLVKTGRIAGTAVEILAGLDPEDKVVTDGAAQLMDGQPLEVK